MHGTLITFDCAASPEELGGPFGEYAQALVQQPGLVSKAWIRTDRGYGGFHVFTDRSAAEGYLHSDLAAGLQANEAFTNFEITHYEVLDELSMTTGVRPITLVGHAS